MTTFNWLETSRLIDVEWLRSVGFRDNQTETCVEMFNGHYWIQCWHLGNSRAVRLKQKDNAFVIGMMDTTTRQMMLDVLRGLKFPIHELC